MTLPTVRKVYRQAKRGHVVLELSCGCRVGTQMLDQHADRPELLRGTTRAMHVCGRGGPGAPGARAGQGNLGPSVGKPVSSTDAARAQQAGENPAPVPTDRVDVAIRAAGMASSWDEQHEARVVRARGDEVIVSKALC